MWYFLSWNLLSCAVTGFRDDSFHSTKLEQRVLYKTTSRFCFGFFDIIKIIVCLWPNQTSQRMRMIFWNLFFLSPVCRPLSSSESFETSAMHCLWAFENVVGVYHKDRNRQEHVALIIWWWHFDNIFRKKIWHFIRKF